MSVPSVILFIVYGVALAVYTGRRFFQDAPLFFRSILGGSAVFALTSVIGTFTYYVYEWNRWCSIVLVFIIPLVVRIVPRHTRPPGQSQGIVEIVFGSATPFRGAIIFTLQLFLLEEISRMGTVAAVRSPWELTAKNFFLLCGVITFIILFHLWRARGQRAGFIIALHVFILFMLASKTFPLGFGFDGHIHRTAMEFIVEHGELLPKTPYYIGAYIPVITAAHLLGTPLVALIDRWLLPAMGALIIPAVVWYALRRFHTTPQNALFAVLTILIVPFATFTVTTPQGIANLFALASVFLAFTQFSPQPVPRLMPVLFALAATAVHPIGGIAALCAIGLLMLRAIKGGIKCVYAAALVVGSAAIYPLIFSYLSHTPLFKVFRLVHTWSPPTLPWPVTLPRPFDPMLDLFYTYTFILPMLILFAISAGTYALIRRTHSWYPISYPLLLAGLYMSAGVVTRLPLHSIISYEQPAFSMRIVETVIILGLPLIAYTGTILYTRLSHASFGIRVAGGIVCTIILMGSFYFSYPRVNQVEASHGYNVSAADFDGVRAIAKDAGPTKYIVLANQAFSAAAIRVHGFTNYYTTEKGLQYFYPIPTGGPLYEYFLAMIYNTPDRATAQRALTFMNAGRLYFVVHKYWWNAEEIKNRARAEAIRSFMIGDAIEIFVFEQ